MDIFKFIIFLVLILAAIQIAYTAYSSYKSRRLGRKIYTGNFNFGSLGNSLKILVVGDSVGAGVGASSLEKSLAGRIAVYLGEKCSVSLNNQSVSGTKMEDLVNRPLPDGKFDLVVIVVGSNNYFHLTNVEKLENDTEKVLAKYVSVGTKVILVGPGRVFETTALPLFVRWFLRLHAAAYTTALKTAADKFKVIHVNPLESKFKTNRYGHTLASDNFHPNDSGYQFWFDLIRTSGALEFGANKL